MKNRFLPVLLAAALLPALCACTPKERMTPPPVTPSINATTTPEATPVATLTEPVPSTMEFSLSVDDVRLTLGATTPCPREPEKTESGVFVYTQEETLRTEYYDGLTLVRNSEYLLSADVAALEIPTWRGVQVGDTREAVEAAYPEAVYPQYDRETITYFEFPDAPGHTITFYFGSGDTVERFYIGGGLD